MATLVTLNALKLALKEISATSSPTKSLTEAQYKAGFDILVQDMGWATYQEFIIPQLCEVMMTLFHSHTRVSVLEIGPGPKSVLEHLPHPLRNKITRYSAFEPNEMFTTSLEQRLRSTSDPDQKPLSRLEESPNIRRQPFVPDIPTADDNSKEVERFNIILFCHSMYGMNPKRRFIERALDMLVEQPDEGRVVVFHRQESLSLDGLLCHESASFPTGVISVRDDDQVLDRFSPFIAGFVLQDADTDERIRASWRETCRTLGHRAPKPQDDLLLFSSPEIMVAFSRHATALPELTAHIPPPPTSTHRTVKNREARLYHNTNIVRPTEIEQVQHCVQWALKHRLGVTIIGGGHTGHCLWPNVVSVDMSAFGQVHIITTGEQKTPDSDEGALVVAGAGCKTEDIIRATMAAGLTVPLGSRPSVGAGLWLQGGIGHLARTHGLACDSIVGAVIVNVSSGHVIRVGLVPKEHCPAGSITVSPEDEAQLLWAIKGAGTNFGIVLSVTFTAYAAPSYSVRNWVVPLPGDLETRLSKLRDFDQRVANKLQRNWSADAYLYWDSDQLQLGVTVYGVSTTQFTLDETHIDLESVLGPHQECQTVDSVGLFATEMYMSNMHGGHGGGKTSAFKRCLFLKHISDPGVASVLMTALETRPSPLCYLHLLHGGGAIGDIAQDAAAFGCRDWDFACVITGVWLRDQDGTEAAQAAMNWVYDIVRDLLPLSTGAYGADLGPDPRDAPLATVAFGPNRLRLAHIKSLFDPHNVLAYTCPLPEAKVSSTAEKTMQQQKLVILVTGESCAGKDFSAQVWAMVLSDSASRSADADFSARVVSISEKTKRDYAASHGADLHRLLEDRQYKEQHRAAMTAYFQEQIRREPQVPQQHFIDVVRSAKDVDVLFITGMRDEAPLATLSPLVPDTKVIEIHVRASHLTRQGRGASNGNDDQQQPNGKNSRHPDDDGKSSSRKVMNYQPTLIFDNDERGTQAIMAFAQESLLPLLTKGVRRLANMIRSVRDFPRQGIEFRHVLDVVQQKGGLPLCTSLLRSHFTGDWSQVDVVACCEAGGFIFAAALAQLVDTPLALIRETGKLPPPTVSVTKYPSHVSSLVSDEPREKTMEMNWDVIPRSGASVVVVDDVLATGKTLCAVLELLNRAGVRAEDVTVMIVAEFPAHRGRELLYRRGFGGVHIQSLLVFNGA